MVTDCHSPLCMIVEAVLSQLFKAIFNISGISINSFNHDMCRSPTKKRSGKILTANTFNMRFYQRSISSFVNSISFIFNFFFIKIHKVYYMAFRLDNTMTFSHSQVCSVLRTRKKHLHIKVSLLCIV